MNRRSFTKSLGLAGLVSLFSFKIAKAESAPRINENFDGVIHVPEPNLYNLRGAVQSLAGQNYLPYNHHRFHGYIDERSITSLMSTEKEKSELDIWKNTGAYFVLPGTGIEFKVVPFVKGAIVFGYQADWLHNNWK